MTMPQESVLEKKETKDYPAIQGFETRALELQKELAENEELAKKDPEKAAGKQKDIERHIAAFWMNVRLAQVSRDRLGDTPQEVSKNAEQLNTIAEKLGAQPVDAFVYYLEKTLPEFTVAAGAIEKALLDKKITASEAVEQRWDLSERLNNFREQKVFLVEEMLRSHDLKKMSKEEKDALEVRVQAIKKKALEMSRMSDASIDVAQEKVEKK